MGSGVGSGEGEGEGEGEGVGEGAVYSGAGSTAPGRAEQPASASKSARQIISLFLFIRRLYHKKTGR